MNKIILLSTALAFILPFSSYGMEVDSQQHKFKRKYQPTNQQYNEDPPLKKGKPQFLSSTERLSTPLSHRRYLQNAISSATQSVLITSHGVDREAFEEGNLYGLLAEARNRGVKVYIYNIDSKDTDGKTFGFFEKCDIAYDVTYTHAKLLAIDNTKVAIGSYNWLSKANNWENATLCLSGQECKEIVPLLWEDLKYYRNLQFGNMKQIEQYESNSQNQVVDTWNLDHSTKLYYFHTLKHHRDFIADAFQSAKNSLVFCAPFINGNSGYKKDFEWNLLSKTINRGVHIHFVCRAEDQNLPSFKNYLGTLLKSPLMHLISLSDIHQKTVIVDRIKIAEGSFNLLSASRDEESEHHNHEVTLMLNGNQSEVLIQDFYNSRVGQEIMKNTPLMPNDFEIFSGGNFGKDGFCVRFDKRDYLVDDEEKTIYFRTERDAEEAALSFMSKKTKPLSRQNSFSNSQWQKNSKSSSTPNDFEIFSGRNFGKDGFCVRFDQRDYLVGDEEKTIYFRTERDAEEAALSFMSKKTKPLSRQNSFSNSQWQKNSKSAPRPNNFEIFSGYKFGKDGFCVRFDKRDYLVDDQEETIYFRTEEEALQAAYEFQ